MAEQKIFPSDQEPICKTLQEICQRYIGTIIQDNTLNDLKHCLQLALQQLSRDLPPFFNSLPLKVIVFKTNDPRVIHWGFQVTELNHCMWNKAYKEWVDWHFPASMIKGLSNEVNTNDRQYGDKDLTKVEEITIAIKKVITGEEQEITIDRTCMGEAFEAIENCGFSTEDFSSNGWQCDWGIKIVKDIYVSGSAWNHFVSVCNDK